MTRGRPPKEAKKIIKCDACGRNLKRYPNQIHDKNFCNMKCMHNWQSENWNGDNNPHWQGGKIEVKCDWCGKTLKLWEALLYNHNFCNIECKSLWQSKYLSGDNSPLLKESIKLTCDWCGENIKRKPGNIHEHNFCNRECSDKWWSNEYHIFWEEHPEEKQRQRERFFNIVFKEKKCLICKEFFIPVSGGQIYCDECKPVYDKRHSYKNTTYLNDWFEGCHRHHITETLVIHIPAELHRHISHNLKTGKNMGEINVIALQYMEVIE